MSNRNPFDRKAAPDLTVLLAICFRAAADELDRELDAAGFSGMRPKHGFVFRNLAEEWITPTELARRLGVSKQAVGKIIDEMEADRLLDRRDDAQDGRKKLVGLSARGQRARKTAAEISRTIEQRMHKRLGAKKAKEMIEALIVLAGELGAEEAIASKRPRPAD